MERLLEQNAGVYHRWNSGAGVACTCSICGCGTLGTTTSVCARAAIQAAVARMPTPHTNLSSMDSGNIAHSKTRFEARNLMSAGNDGVKTIVRSAPQLRRSGRFDHPLSQSCPRKAGIYAAPARFQPIARGTLRAVLLGGGQNGDRHEFRTSDSSADTEKDAARDLARFARLCPGAHRRRKSAGSGSEAALYEAAPCGATPLCSRHAAAAPRIRELIASPP